MSTASARGSSDSVKYTSMISLGKCKRSSGECLTPILTIWLAVIPSPPPPPSLPRPSPRENYASLSGMWTMMQKAQQVTQKAELLDQQLAQVVLQCRGAVFRSLASVSLWLEKLCVRLVATSVSLFLVGCQCGDGPEPVHSRR